VVRVTRALLATLVLVCAALPAAAHAYPRYVGYLGDGTGRAYHRAGQGGLHYLVLTDSDPASNRRYRVCLRGGAENFRGCFKRRLRFGFHKLNVSRLINDQGGPGRYRAQWYIGGRRVAIWRFRLTSEFG
jgi:hypothetical protein